MGYFTNGFVFTAEPDFAAVGAAIPDRLARGYKHKRLPVWLLDLWEPPRKPSPRRAPFSDPASDGFRVDLASVDVSTRDFLAALQRLKEAVGDGTTEPECGCVHLALAVTAATRRPAFFFAADDEEIDLGCRAAPGSLVSFGCRRTPLTVEYRDGRATVTPLNFPEDEDEDDLRDLIARVSRVEGVSVLPPRDIEGGLPFYENPVAQWPGEAGDPAELLGLGTWDPLLDIERDFAVVFDRAQPE